jgi:RND family efflux transporter MFP subunit
MRLAPARSLFAALILALPACTAPAPAAEPVSVAEPAAVTVAVPEPVAVPDVRAPDSLVAVVVARREVAIAPRRAGTVARIEVALGDRVSAGQVVARLDDAEATADVDSAGSAVRAARAEARRARSDLRQARERARRRDQLVRDGVLASEEAEDARYAVARAEEARRAALADVERAETAAAQLGRDRAAAALTATFDGRVAAVHHTTGAQVGAGAAVVTIVSDDRIVRFAAPASQSAAIVPGAAITFTTADGVALTGQITSVAPELDAGARMLFAEAALDDAAATPAIRTVGRLAVATR